MEVQRPKEVFARATPFLYNVLQFGSQKKYQIDKVPYVWKDHDMEMKLHNLKNREGGRESSHNKSFQGWKVEEIDAFAEQLAAKDDYVWESETKQLVLNYIKYKVRSNNPITSLKRVRQLIAYSKILSDFCMGNKIKPSKMTLKQGHDFVRVVQFSPNQKGKPYSRETQITIYKIFKALIRFSNSSRNVEPFNYLAGGGLAYILDYEVGNSNFKVSTYTESDMNLLLNSKDWFSQFIYNHLYHTGCRINEFIDSNLNDYLYDQKNDVIIWRVKVSKTRNGIRSIPIGGKPKENLMVFFNVYHNINLSEWVPSESTKNRPLLIYREGHANGKRLQYRTLSKMLKADCQAKGISLPHHFKRFRSSGATKDAMNPQISDSVFDIKYGHSIGGGMRRRYVNKNDEQVMETLASYEKVKHNIPPVAASGLNFNTEQIQAVMNLINMMQHK